MEETKQIVGRLILIAVIAPSLLLLLLLLLECTIEWVTDGDWKKKPKWLQRLARLTDASFSDYCTLLFFVLPITGLVVLGLLYVVYLIATLATSFVVLTTVILLLLTVSAFLLRWVLRIKKYIKQKKENCIKY